MHLVGFIIRKFLLTSFLLYDENTWSRAILVGTVTRLVDGRLRNRGSISGRRRRFISSPKHRDRLWGPQNHIFNGYRE